MTRRPAFPLLALAALLVSGAALAKLPAPSDDAKAKAAEAAAKAAHAGKVDGYKLCLSMDKVAAGYQAAAKKAGKAASAPTDTPACADPGAFVYTPAGGSACPGQEVAPRQLPTTVNHVAPRCLLCPVACAARAG